MSGDHRGVVRAGQADELTELVEWLSAWTWPVPREQLKAAARDRGWTVAFEEAETLGWDTDLPPGASAVVLDGVTATLTIETSEEQGSDAAGRRALRDLFAGQVAVVSQVLGPPVQHVPGHRASATWDMANGSSLKVMASSGSCSWVLKSPEFVEIERGLGPNA